MVRQLVLQYNVYSIFDGLGTPTHLAVESFLNAQKFPDEFVASGGLRIVLALALTILHLWLPYGQRTLGGIWPGIAATLVLWLACGIAFGRYLSGFAYTYVTYYAGLASAMIALVFLYYSAWIFIFGGELNAAIARVRAAACLQTLPPRSLKRGWIAGSAPAATPPRSRRRDCAAPGAAY